jgi:hypothetical protein
MDLHQYCKVKNSDKIIELRNKNLTPEEHQSTGQGNSERYFKMNFKQPDGLAIELNNGEIYYSDQLEPLPPTHPKTPKTNSYTFYINNEDNQ